MCIKKIRNLLIVGAAVVSQTALAGLNFGFHFPKLNEGIFAGPAVYHTPQLVTVDGDLSDWDNLDEKFEVTSEQDGVKVWSAEHVRDYYWSGKERQTIETYYAIKIDKNKTRLQVKDLVIKRAYVNKKDGTVYPDQVCTKNLNSPLAHDGCIEWKDLPEADRTYHVISNFVDLPLTNGLVKQIREDSNFIYIEGSSQRSAESFVYRSGNYELHRVPNSDANVIYKVIVTFDHKPNTIQPRVMPYCEGHGGCGSTFPHTTMFSISGSTPKGKLSFSVSMNTKDQGDVNFSFSEMPTAVDKVTLAAGITVFNEAEDIDATLAKKYSVLSINVPIDGCPGCKVGVVVDNLGQILGETAFYSASQKSFASLLSGAFGNEYLDSMKGLPEYVNIDGVEMIVDSYQSGNEGGNYGGDGDNHHGNDRESRYSGGVNENSDGCNGCNTPWGGR
ncbi:TPA: hypothetical protein ACRZ4F_001564 [Vibrio harveyi]